MAPNPPQVDGALSPSASAAAAGFFGSQFQIAGGSLAGKEE